MFRVLKELWPALVPIMAYVIWYVLAYRKAKCANEVCPRFSEGPWGKTLLVSAVIAIACIFILIITEEAEKGAYHPPRLENGKVVPGTFAP